MNCISRDARGLSSASERAELRSSPFRLIRVALLLLTNSAGSRNTLSSVYIVNAAGYSVRDPVNNIEVCEFTLSVPRSPGRCMLAEKLNGRKKDRDAQPCSLSRHFPDASGTMGNKFIAPFPQRTSGHCVRFYGRALGAIIVVAIVLSTELDPQFG